MARNVLKLASKVTREMTEKESSDFVAKRTKSLIKEATEGKQLTKQQTKKIKAQASVDAFSEAQNKTISPENSKYKANKKTVKEAKDMSRVIDHTQKTATKPAETSILSKMKVDRSVAGVEAGGTVDVISNRKRKGAGTPRTLNTPTSVTKNNTKNKYIQSGFNAPEGAKNMKFNNIESKGFEKNGSFFPTENKANVKYKTNNGKTRTKDIISKKQNFNSNTNSNSNIDKIFNQKNLKTAVGAGVSGAIVLSMFNNGGEMSNSELYGQQQRY